MRRSYQIVNRVSSIKITNANSALRATTHHRSLKNTSRSIGASGLIRVPPYHLPPCDCKLVRRPNRHQITGTRGEVLRNSQPWSSARQPHDPVDHF